MLSVLITLTILFLTFSHQSSNSSSEQQVKQSTEVLGFQSKGRRNPFIESLTLKTGEKTKIKEIEKATEISYRQSEEILKDFNNTLQKIISLAQKRKRSLEELKELQEAYQKFYELKNKLDSVRLNEEQSKKYEELVSKFKQIEKTINPQDLLLQEAKAIFKLAQDNFNKGVYIDNKYLQEIKGLEERFRNLVDTSKTNLPEIDELKSKFQELSEKTAAYIELLAKNIKITGIICSNDKNYQSYIIIDNNYYRENDTIKDRIVIKKIEMDSVTVLYKGHELILFMK